MTLYSGKIAARMQKIRFKMGIPVSEVIQSMSEDGYEIGEPAYRHWENGIRPQHVDALPSIARALGVKLHELLPKS